jgi:hypothetical protein
MVPSFRWVFRFAIYLCIILFQGQTAVVKNVERQRYRKQGGVDSQSGSGGSAAGSRTTLSMTVERDGRDRDREREQYYPNDHAYTMTKTWDPVTGEDYRNLES